MKPNASKQIAPHKNTILNVTTSLLEDFKFSS